MDGLGVALAVGHVAHQYVDACVDEELVVELHLIAVVDIDLVGERAEHILKK